jgi:hypothetical protein
MCLVEIGMRDPKVDDDEAPAVKKTAGASR